jgi:hypothetical protein
METISNPEGMKRRDLFKLIAALIGSMFAARTAKPQLPTISLGFEPGFIPEQVAMMRDPNHPAWHHNNPQMFLDPGRNHTLQRTKHVRSTPQADR